MAFLPTVYKQYYLTMIYLNNIIVRVSLHNQSTCFVDRMPSPSQVPQGIL